MEFVAGFVGGLSIFLALYLFYKLLRAVTNGDRRAVRIRRVPGAAGGFGHPAERVPQQGHGRSEDRALAGAGSGGERGLPLHPRRQVRGHGVEALSCERVRVFGDLPGRAVRHSHAARSAAVQPRRASRAVLGSRVQHRRQLRHEHELAGVQRRERAQLLLPGDRPDGAELRHAPPWAWAFCSRCSAAS